MATVATDTPEAMLYMHPERLLLADSSHPIFKLTKRNSGLAATSGAATG